MPFTEQQRKYFHAAAERGEKGMSALASEADQLVKEGKERPPVREHVEMSEGGVAMCKHCGGAVGEDGYSEGGIVQDGDHDAESELEAMKEGDTGELPQQYQNKERMRHADSDFAAALMRRRGGR